jgi:hypothetical protein
MAETNIKTPEEIIAEANIDTEHVKRHLALYKACLVRANGKETVAFDLYKEITFLPNWWMKGW